MKKIIALFFAILLLQSVCFAEVVLLNTKTNKYHKPTCQWAKQCTVNCIKIEKKEAVKQGARPCKVCGG